MKTDGRDIILQLIAAYEEEARLYEGVYRAASEQTRILQNGRDPQKLARLVEQQRRLSEDIGRIETGISPLREYWEKMSDHYHGPHVAGLTRTLDALLEDLITRIEEIVEIEKENTRELLGTTTR